MNVDLKLLIRFQCGCKAPFRVNVDLPPELANAERTEANDRAVIGYVIENYKVENLTCPNRHRAYTMRGFDKILEILN